MIVEFAEWLPDLPAFNNPGSTEAQNVLPSGNSYKQVPALSIYSNALSATCKGAISARNPTSGVSTNFAGDASKLYQMASAVWSDVSKASGYTVTSDEKWYFTQFGNRVIATQIGNPVQSFTLDSSALFADLSATAPQARYVAEVANFLVFANTYDAIDGYVPYRIRWSPINDPAGNYTVSASTQADYTDLNASFGWCQQVVGGEFGVVFQERAITRIDYSGSPLVFQVRRVEENKGTQAPGSVIKVGNFIYYLGLDGFYVFDGTQSIPIGANKIDQTFMDDVDNGYLWNISSAVDYTNKIIAWAYAGSGNTGGRCNKILFYNYAPNSTKRWSYAVVDIEHLYSSLSEGYTMESLDTLSTNLDSLDRSLDSRFYTGNRLLLSAFDSSHKLNTFSGSTYLTAVLDTQEAQITPGGRTDLFLVRPIIDGSGTVTIQLGTRNLQSESVTWGNVLSLNSIGNCETRSNARFHRARVSITGGFNHAMGLEILEAKPAGMR